MAEAEVNEETKLDLKPTVDAFDDFGRALLGLVDIFWGIAEKVAAALENASPFLHAIGAKDWADVLRVLDELPTKSKAAMRQTLGRGWFFGWHGSLQSLVELVQSLSAAGEDEIDRLMLTYYRANLRAFADELMANHPKRAAVFDAAVRAHTEMKDAGYLLSVPVFIAQADGILAEITGVQQPMKNGAEAVIRKYGADAELLDLLYPFLELKNSPFAMSAKAREKHLTDEWLNRHEVMHGERSDYGTETNSLKAFSFLVFAGLHIPAVLPAVRSQ